VRRADNLADLYADFLEILRASSSWNPKGLSRPAEGQLYPQNIMGMQCFG